MPSSTGTSRLAVVLALGATQTLAWASTYYLPAVLADEISASLGLSRDWFFGIFSASLFFSGLLGPMAGRAIDNRGGRDVLVLSNIVCAVGLVALALSYEVIGLAAAWSVLGAGMALGLYDAAFATLTGLYRLKARGAITGITLIAGFASTVGWPLTTLLSATFGWRETCLVWAALHLFLGLPLNRLLVPQAPPPEKTSSTQGGAAPTAAMILVAIVFAAALFIQAAMAAHLPRLLEALGTTHAAAVAAGAFMGPAQVGARIFEYSVLRHISAIASARVAAALHPLGIAVLAVLGAPAAIAFALLHGAGNGMMTIAKGVLPLALFGAAGYGLRSGILSVPGRALQASAPLLFSLVLDNFGAQAGLYLSGGFGLCAVLALLVLRHPRGDNSLSPQESPAR